MVGIRSWQTRLRRGLTALTLSFPAALAGAAPPDAQSQDAFPPERFFVDERPPRLRLVSTVLRKRLGEDFYVLGLYVDMKELHVRVGPGRTGIPSLAKALASGRVSHAYVTRFERGIGRERRVGFLQENLKKAWPDGSFNPDDAAVKRFCSFFDKALNRRDETQVWVGSWGSIYTRAAGQPPAETKAPVLCHAFAASYFGDDCMDEMMKQEMLKDLLAVLDKEAPQGKTHH